MVRKKQREKARTLVDKYHFSGFCSDSEDAIAKAVERAAEESAIRMGGKVVYDEERSNEKASLHLLSVLGPGGLVHIASINITVLYQRKGEREGMNYVVLQIPKFLFQHHGFGHVTINGSKTIARFVDFLFSSLDMREVQKAPSFS